MMREQETIKGLRPTLLDPESLGTRDPFQDKCVGVSALSVGACVLVDLSLDMTHLSS